MAKAKANVRKTWGIYVYIAGDNNLSDNGLIDITEMVDAGGSKDVHIAVQIDTKGDFDGSVRYEISEPDFAGKSHRIVIQRLPEEDTGDPKFLSDFLKWAAVRYPATNRLLVVWNHGAGFMHTPTRDIGYDDSSLGDALTMAELRWALSNAGFGTGSMGKLSLIGFDACLMNMLEVAYEYVGYTDYVVGSQQTEPADGWPYDDVVRRAKVTKAPIQLATSIVKDYIASYKKTGQQGVTQSAMDVATLATLSASVEALGALLIKAMPASRGKILEARVATQGYEEPTYVDLVDLTQQLKARLADSTLKKACDTVKAAVSKAVVKNGKLGGSVSRSSGVSVWFPIAKTDYVTRRSEYVALQFARDYPQWPRFLDVLLAL
jgi:cysteine peptidase C11 family protein